MHEWNSLSHVRWDCKYHIVFVPKYRKKALYGKTRRQVREILLSLSKQLGVEILEGHLMRDHVHMCLKVAPKYSISYVIGFLKGKSAVRIHRALGYKRMTLVGIATWFSVPDRRTVSRSLPGSWLSSAGRRSEDRYPRVT